MTKTTDIQAGELTHHSAIIQFIEEAHGSKRYKIIGEPTAADWRKEWENEGKPEPSCEFTIPVGHDYVGSFGGNLWPLAWPHLFVQRGYAPCPTELGWRVIRSGRFEPCPYCEELGLNYDPTERFHIEDCPSYPVEFDADCCACLRGNKHTQLEHEAILRRNEEASRGDE